MSRSQPDALGKWEGQTAWAYLGCMHKLRYQQLVFYDTFSIHDILDAYCQSIQRPPLVVGIWSRFRAWSSTNAGSDAEISTHLRTSDVGTRRTKWLSRYAHALTILSRSSIRSRRDEAYSSTVMVLFLSSPTAWVAVKLQNRGTMVNNGRGGDGGEGLIWRRLKRVFSQKRGGV